MTSGSKKIVNLIQLGETNFKYSFEITPNINIEDIENLEADPIFFAITWHAKLHQCKDLHIAPLKTACLLRSKQKQVMMHLSCDLLRKHYLEKVLAFLQENEICNLFVVLGESYDSSKSDFKSTMELIKYIRDISGQYFCIGVAGFCDHNGGGERLLHLKEKIEAGADFIITQAFFEASIFKAFLEKCYEIGINVPIIPGMFAFENYEQLTNFIKMCKVEVSDNFLEYVKKNESNEIVGVEVMKTLIHAIRDEYTGSIFHFFTMNKLNNVCNAIKELKN